MRTPRRGVTLKNAQDVGPPRDATDIDLTFFAIYFGGPAVLLVVLTIWVLWKPLLAVVLAPPDAARRDLAYRIRAIGYPVEVVKDVLRVKVDSIAQLKLRLRAGARGTEIRYEVDATNVGWSLVLITGLITYLAIIAVGVSIAIHLRARGFARSRVAPLLDDPPLGTLPPADVRSLLLEGLSEAQRLSQEALDYEREARQNAIGIVLLAGLVVWGVVFAGLAIELPLQLPDPLASAAILASFLSGLTVVLGSWLVYLRRSPRIRELEQDANLYRTAWMGQRLPGSAAGEPRANLEMLLRAATRSPLWREIRASRRFWHDPVAGLMMFILGYGAIFLPFLAILGVGLPWEWRAFLGVFGAAFAAGGIWFVRSWIREIQDQDDRDRRTWEERRAAIEAELWRILSG
jgi:hypothetical protein